MAKETKRRSRGTGVPATTRKVATMLLGVGFVVYANLVLFASSKLPVRDPGLVPFIVPDYLQENNRAARSMVARKNPNLKNMTFRPVEYVNEYEKPYEFCSGMWWQRVQDFLQLEHVVDPDIHDADEASLHAFEKIGFDKVFMTRDWLDLSVEHLSSYWEIFEHIVSEEQSHEGIQTEVDKETEYVFQTITSKLRSFIDKAERFPTSRTGSAVPKSTIAIVPLATYSKQGSYEERLRETSLIATLASLWRIGLPRVVLVGTKAEHKRHVDQATAALKSKLDKSPMEIVFLTVNISQRAVLSTVDQLSLAGQGALQALQVAFQGTESKKWLGDDPKRWKYVYFSEPDLLLNTRPSAFESFRKQLDKGMLLTSHRLQLLQHSIDFPKIEHDKQRLVPNVTLLTDMQDLDATNPLDACCDMGLYYPARYWNTCHHFKSDGFWWICGRAGNKTHFPETDDPDILVARNAQIAVYPMIRLTQGVGVVGVDHHERLCLPIREGSCDDLPKLEPKKSKW